MEMLQSPFCDHTNAIPSTVQYNSGHAIDTYEKSKLSALSIFTDACKLKCNKFS